MQRFGPCGWGDFLALAEDLSFPQPYFKTASPEMGSHVEFAFQSLSGHGVS